MWIISFIDLLNQWIQRELLILGGTWLVPSTNGFPKLQEPVLPGCFLRAKAIGLMPMIDQVCEIILDYVLVARQEKLTLSCLGGERRQDNRCLCWWSWVPSLQWHQGASTTSFGWNTSFLWRLYPFHLFSNTWRNSTLVHND